MSEQIEQLVIVADDLTGALDMAAPFCAPDSSVVVATRPEAFADALARNADVTAVSTRTRDVDPDAASRCVASIIGQIPPGSRILKKVDSRLKGQIAAELSALPSGRLLVLPAIPEFGRIVQAEELRGFGVPTPIQVRDRLGPRGAQAQIPDTVSQAEMRAAFNAADDCAVLVGARGLAQAMADTAGITRRRPDPLTGRIGVAVGSTDPITLEQVAELTDATHLLAPSGKTDLPATLNRVTLMQAVIGPDSDPRRIAQALARSFVPLAGKVGSLILTGGATAEAVLDALNVEILTVEGEIVPGLPLSAAKGWRIVTKSGGFGVPSALNDLTRDVE